MHPGLQSPGSVRTADVGCKAGAAPRWPKWSCQRRGAVSPCPRGGILMHAASCKLISDVEIDWDGTSSGVCVSSSRARVQCSTASGWLGGGGSSSPALPPPHATPGLQ